MKSHIIEVPTNLVGRGAVRVTIPAVIRNALGIRAGDIVEMSIRGDAVVMRKKKTVKS